MFPDLFGTVAGSAEPSDDAVAAPPDNAVATLPHNAVATLPHLAAQPTIPAVDAALHATTECELSLLTFTTPTPKLTVLVQGGTDHGVTVREEGPHGLL